MKLPRPSFQRLVEKYPVIRRPWFGALTIAVAVNLLLLVLRLASHSGQTTVVQIAAVGDQHRLLVDGKQAIPDPSLSRDESATLDTPLKGGISLTLAAGVPSMPGPQGIDSIVVKTPAGNELMRDNFDRIDTDRWDVSKGSFRIEDGVLVATTRGDANTLTLRGDGWDDYILTITYRNAMAVGVETRRQESGRTFYSFNLLRDFPVYVETYGMDGTWNGTIFGGYVHTNKLQTSKSFIAMVVGSYPLPLVAIGLGVLATLALSFAGSGLERWRTRWPAGLGFLGPLRQKLRPLLWPAVVFGFAVASLGVCAHIMWEYYRRVPHLPDEASYLYEGKLFAAGHIVRAIPSPKEAFYFWSPNFLYEHAGRWSTIYPFGHPLTLAVGELFDAAWLVTPVCGALCVGLMFLVGRRMYDARTGAAAAVLLAASPFFLIQSANFMSHTPWMLYTLLSLNFLLNRRRSILFGVLSGLALGMALNTRPTETAMLLPAVGVVLLCYLIPKTERRQGVYFGAAFCVGMGIMLALSLGYNAATTGSPMTSAYLDWDFPGATLGFNHGNTLDIGMRNEQALLMALVLLLNVWPTWVGLAFVLLPFVLGTRNRWDYFCLACIVLVTSVYVLYRWSGIYEGPRYWYQAVPFLMLLTARGAERAAIVMASLASGLRTRLHRPPRYEHAGALLIAYGVIVALIVSGSGGWLFGWNKTWLEPDSPQVPNELKYVKDLYRFDDRLTNIEQQLKLHDSLILVKTCGIWESWGCFTAVFPDDSVSLDGDVVWARYIADHNGDTVAAFPGRKVYVADFDASTIVPYDKDKDP